MARVKLDIETIGTLDERVKLAFEYAVKQAVIDCMDRPSDKAARTVNLEFSLKPICEQDGTCDGCEGEFSVKCKVPARKSKTYSFDAHKGGQLSWHSNHPEDRDQTTIDDMGPDGRVKPE